MPIQAFSFPIPETRFFQVGQHVYKFKIRPGNKISGEEDMLDSEFVNEELENTVRVVLMSLDNLHPFSTRHFNIFPYKSRWERVSELTFRKGNKKFSAYPFLITLYVEMNEPIPPLTVNHANKWDSAVRESTDKLDTPPISCAVPTANEPKRRRIEEPQEGPLSSDHHYDKGDTSLCLHELPNLCKGAEEMFCGNKINADSEESSESDIVEQDAPDSKSTEREKSGLLARLASIAAFPFFLLFRRS